MSTISGLHDKETSQEDGVVAALAGGDSTEEEESDNTAEFVHEMIDEEFYADEAGPSGLQPPVVVQEAICGGDPPYLCEYEQLRERNIREREEAMREALDEIEEIKEEIRENAPISKKRRTEKVAGGRSKEKKLRPAVEVRRSGREKKPVTYGLEEDVDEDMFGRERRRANRGTTKGRKRVSKLGLPPSSASSPHNLRPRKPINYAEGPELEADSFIWCSTCNRPEFNGCEVHTPFFGDNQEFKLEVEPSSVGGKDAGDGVFNRGDVIPEGVLFGPYSGEFITTSVYKEMEKSYMESGNAWELRDKNNKHTVGYIDPGKNPDPRQHWMSKINCPSKTSNQNLVGFQLAGQIYYRVICNIPTGVELLVWYGKTFARGLGIKVETVDKYSRREDLVKDALFCNFCKTGMEGEEELEGHLGKGDGRVYRCVVKQAKEMVRMAECGERKHVCELCGKGFQTMQHLSIHGTLHSEVKAFQCDAIGCGKKFTQVGHLSVHMRVVHEGVKLFECPECGKRFGRKSHMTRHNKTVHLEEKHYKCGKCGVQFGQKSSLAMHIKTVHEQVRAFKCEHCDKSFGLAGARKQHVQALHLNMCYPCTWSDCSYQAHTKAYLKIHQRRTHTKEWSLECQLCEDQLDIWWGCINPSEMNNHRAKKHPVEWEEEQETFKRDNPFICRNKRCLNRFRTKIECDRHEMNMH